MPIYFKDRQSRFILVSEATAAKHGLTPEQMVGLTDAEFFDSAQTDTFLAEEQQIMETGVPASYKEVHETWIDRPDSWAVTTKRPLRDLDGRILGIVGISQDVTQRVTTERRAAKALADLNTADAQLRAVLENSPDAISGHDRDLRFTDVNSGAEHLLRLPKEQLLGCALKELAIDPAISEVWEGALRLALRSGEQTETEGSAGSGSETIWLQSRIAAERDADGRIVSMLTSTRDITQLKLAEQTMARQALRDAVTGLANRTLLTDRLRQALVCLERRPGHIGLLFVDLDHFKEVNDTYGHHIGDSVLFEMGRRFEGVARKTDTVARLGGDEFVLLFETIESPLDASGIAHRVVEVTAQPVQIGDLSVSMSASVGVVLTDDPSSDASVLLAKADAAMYRVKRGGRNGFCVWDALLDEHKSGDRAIKAGLHRG
jgi:diguanylate cyclase (GGDEF)-like protein/PAS domain S-box-containing protein